MRIEAVTDIRRWWGFVAPGIQQVKEICSEPWLVEDVYARLVAEPPKATLFVFIVNGEPKGFSVVELCPEYGTLLVNFWILHFVQQIEPNREELTAWVDDLCRKSGCRKARFVSPRAWQSLLRGVFKEKAVIYEREVP